MLCVPATDPRTAEIKELDDVAGHELDEIAHFFAIYKALEPGKDTEVQGWRGGRPRDHRGVPARYQAH